MRDAEKWIYLRDIPHEDARDERIRMIASLLWQATRLSPDRPRLFAILVHALTGRGLRMVRDTDRTGGEDIAGLTRAPSKDDAIEALMRGADDCDAKARLFVALHIAAGLPARMRPVWKARPGGADEELTHVYPEVNLDGKWQAAETTLARALIGEPPLMVPRESSGIRLQT